VQDIDAERQRLCQEFERQKKAKLTELKTAEERRQMINNTTTDVSVRLSVLLGFLFNNWPVFPRLPSVMLRPPLVSSGRN